MRVFMFAHGGSLNRGCEAIVRSTTHIIKDRINGAQVYLASGKPETDRIITELDEIYDGSDSPITKYSLGWWVSSLKVKLFQDESYALGKIKSNITKHVSNMDVCLSIGGDNYCYGEQPDIYEVDKRIKAQGKKLVLWGCSIGEEDLSKRKLEDLKLFDLILARETLTLELLKKSGLTNVKLCADSAFTMKKEELPLPEGWQEGNTVGLNFSPLVWNRNKQSRTAVRDLIQHILNTTDMTIALTPHVIQDGNNDYELLLQFFNEFTYTNRVILLPDHLNAMQYKGYIARMRFFIGARTHATIAAYSSFVPTLVLGYSIKSRGISKDIFGEEKLVLGVNDISDSSKLTAVFDEMIKEERTLIRQLKQSIPHIQKMAYQSVEYLTELAM
ncbi:polysaccharide pyruvyl transferase family protein [Ferviditalea candida]|uniref:Polysaccharide pyruvyl transferase family protein n=1 Tax=Ferviditalea candida TaxID=3108399 RepID=A0ABU5ZFZ0_9BACL|nr:polysaccharide pyruvyl transferase family protein [Paenibacillaceae bacterium T2]